MKKKILIPIILLSLMISGCGGVHWSYDTAIKAINNDYFKTNVIHEDNECMIIQNEVTGEYFLVVTGASGLSICPIQTEEEDEEIWCRGRIF